ncbi:hypothetical protein S40285_06720 [Stachybotrys chlorohalonatus IBT 40285]|uniref:N-acetyltransferase domain-containing protein n=1 Tax=Stachybotrys chlorohalonatus (strain IBT 40285) TaxID=1283841 RepID=A0A084QTG2_STAC4|nr:hypothetical protein S40285_06720 [Stachybotrys chlorohalonata IBT 40285]
MSLASEVVVPATTLTPTIESPTPHREPVTIAVPPASAAQDAQLVSRLTSIVNRVFAVTASNLFTEGFQRTSAEEVAQLIRNGELAVASVAGDPAAPDELRKVIGCVSIKVLTPKSGRLGMLALDTAYQGGGTGRELANFAENLCRQKGCSVMHVEALIPTTFEDPFRMRLASWYLRLGYRLVKKGNFCEDYPEIAGMLSGPTDYMMYEKSLSIE